MKQLKRNILFFVITGIIASSCSPHKKLASTGSSHSTAGSHAALQTKYSTLLNVDMSNIRNVPLYALIDDWYGTTYKYGGCDRNGIDCSNFATILYQEIYKKAIKGSSASIYNQCLRVSKTELQEGDLVFFKIGKQTISHVGVYLQNNKFVHATTQRGVMINDLNEPYYLKYYYDGGRLK